MFASHCAKYGVLRSPQASEGDRYIKIQGAYGDRGRVGCCGDMWEYGYVLSRLGLQRQCPGGSVH